MDKTALEALVRQVLLERLGGGNPRGEGRAGAPASQ